MHRVVSVDSKRQRVDPGVFRTCELGICRSKRLNFAKANGLYTDRLNPVEFPNSALYITPKQPCRASLQYRNKRSKQATARRERHRNRRTSAIEWNHGNLSSFHEGSIHLVGGYIRYTTGREDGKADITLHRAPEKLRSLDSTFPKPRRSWRSSAAPTSVALYAPEPSMLLP